MIKRYKTWDFFFLFVWTGQGREREGVDLCFTPSATMATSRRSSQPCNQMTHTEKEGKWEKMLLWTPWPAADLKKTRCPRDEEEYNSHHTAEPLVLNVVVRPLVRIKTAPMGNDGNVTLLHDLLNRTSAQSRIALAGLRQMDTSRMRLIIFSSTMDDTDFGGSSTLPVQKKETQT